jgi:hypothetical protein
MIRNERSIQCKCGANIVQGIVVFRYPSGACRRFIERFDVIEESKAIDPSSGQEGLNVNLAPHRCDDWVDLVTFFPEVMTVEAVPEEGH